MKKYVGLFLSTGLLAACTGQLPDSFRFEQQLEQFQTDAEVNTKVDILWVIDNSPSMWPSQKKIRDGVVQFADTYMKPNWDIRVSVISQDTYLANSSFRNFVNGVGVTGSAQRYSRANGYQSTYLNHLSGANPHRTTAFVSPAWWTTTAINSSGTVTGGGIKLRHGVPEYGGADATADVSVSNPSTYARLIPGRHDGPLQSMCWTSASNTFFYGVTNCSVRDQQDVYTGVDECVNGGSGNHDSSLQCVNTIMNNTVRSGKPIIETKPPTGTAGDATWIAQLNKDLIVNLSGGVSGYPLEKFFNSIDQLVTDNESSATKFFRPNALRVIVIVSDEDDQSSVFPGSQITPDDQYDDNTSCPWKTVDAHTYRLQTCPKSASIYSVSTFKTGLDNFFKNLDGDVNGNPNYFVVSIGPTTGAVLKSLHDSMGENGSSYGAVSSDLPNRIHAFADSVGNGSLKLEIASSDYSDMLDQIGQTIVQKKNTFKLKFQPSSKDDILVWIKHADGSKDAVDQADFSISGYELTITNDTLLLSLTDTDHVVVDYQPGSLDEIL